MTEDLKFTKADVLRYIPGGLQITNEYVLKFGKKRVNENSLKNLQLKGTSASIKTSTQNYIVKILLTWLKSINCHNYYHKKKSLYTDYFPTFITLTLCSSQQHADIFIKKNMLIPFIEDLKRLYFVENYFWKAESQKNDNIHFHVLIDKYIDKFDVQNLWIKYLEKYNYLMPYRAKFGDKKPPCTDIKAIYNIHLLSCYLLKYVCKKELNRPILGLKWGCSDAIKKIENFSYIIDNKTTEIIERLHVTGKVKMWYNEYVTIFTFTKEFNYNTDFKYFETLETSHLLEVYKTLYLGATVGTQ